IKTGLEIAVEIPRGIFGSSEKMIKQLKTAKAAGVKIACAGTLDAMELARCEGFSVVAGLGSNIFNSQALESLKNSGVLEATLSFELTLAQAAALKGSLPRGLIAYGRLPLMLTRNCPLSNGSYCKDCDGRGEITDRMGIKFPVVCNNGCAEVLNSRPLYMADRLGEMKNIDFMTLYFTRETKQECGAIIKAYRDGKAPQGDYTRGLYYRGVD
ncbi:MAG TPA: U32 family peptidase, partial [Clostridia bacterium]|nr:U32 family peptidase [Clostridia bacterium]